MLVAVIVVAFVTLICIVTAMLLLLANVADLWDVD